MCDPPDTSLVSNLNGADKYGELHRYVFICVYARKRRLCSRWEALFRRGKKTSTTRTYTHTCAAKNNLCVPISQKCEMFYNGNKCRALVYCNEDDDCVCMTRRKDRTRQDLREQYLLRVFLATTKQSASARTWTTSSNCNKITPGQRQVQVHLLQLQQTQGLNLLNTLAVTTTTTRAPSTTAIMGPASMN